MIDKVQKIRDKVEKLKSQLLRGACSSQVTIETRCKEEAYNEVLAILDTMQEEPVSESLEEEISRCILDEDMNFESCARHFANWQKQQMMKNAVDSIVHCDKFGVILPKEDLKKAVDNLPELQVYDKVKLLIIKED